MLVKLGGKFHEKPSKGEEGLWRVAEMATKNAMFIGQPHTQRHLWRKRNGQKLDREVDSSKSLANSNTYLAHNRVQIFFEGSFLPTPWLTRLLVLGKSRVNQKIVLTKLTIVDHS